LDTFADVVLFAGNLLAARHDAFTAAEVDDDRVAFDPADRAGGDLPDAILVLFVNAAPLVLADELDHDLLNGLRPDASDRALEVERHARPPRLDVASGALTVT
jgi:hypothetical protein